MIKEHGIDLKEDNPFHKVSEMVQVKGVGVNAKKSIKPKHLNLALEKAQLDVKHQSRY